VLTKRTAIVFGASGGIGHAVVERLARQWRVVAAVRNANRSVELAEETIVADIRSFDDVSAVFDAAGGSDCVVNCAGVGYYAPLDSDYSRFWTEMLATNVTGMLNILTNVYCRDACSHVVHIGSLAAHRPSRTVGGAVYSASKAAALPLLDHLREMLRAAGRRTRVTLISPGFVGDTAFGERYFESAPDRATDLYSTFPPLTPIDVATAVETALAAPEGTEIGTLVVRPIGQGD
jgi:NADP-dependent 3-hydroxy acid dehydrogenase YdfG